MANSKRRLPRITTQSREAFLPPRVLPPARVVPLPGNHTYYLSCDVRSFGAYIPLAVRQVQRGFRAALLAPAGLTFEPPGVQLLGLQHGDSFDHAAAWAASNPIEEIHAEALVAKRSGSLKDQTKAQKRFANAVASLDGVQEALREAEAELDGATADIIATQGVEVLVIDGAYYDPSYSRERVYLKKRDPRISPTVDVEALEKPAKKASKRRKRAA